MTVYLVGAGPGDPGLLTVRGAEVLGRADVVVYDRLAHPGLLDLAPPEAERIYVGKEPGAGRPTQAEINELLITHGRAGRTVVRLKGGDPFVFARGGEEVAALDEAGVPFEVVPGVTSAIAVPAYAGIPVTLRYQSTSFTVLTGHEDPAKGTELDWEAAARLGGTLVVLMGAARIGAIARRLMDAGMDPGTPVAVVTRGTRVDQRSVTATLATVGDLTIEPPATIVIGQVVSAARPWFERRPLFGRRVVITRPAHQTHALARTLGELGAEVIPLPAIATVPPADGYRALDGAAARVGTYDWVVFTSANAVEPFLSRVGDMRRLAGVRLAAIGPATAGAVTGWRVGVDLVAPTHVAESLVEVFPEGPGRVLLPRAAVARDVLPRGLAAKGWEVDVVEAYRTVPAPAEPSAVEAARGADAICFTSSSTVTAHLGAGRPVPPVVVCIGPVTAATARDAGLEVTAVAEPHTAEGIVTALLGVLGTGADPPDGPDRP